MHLYKREVPSFIKLLAILNYIGAGIFSLFAPLLIFLGVIAIFSPPKNIILPSDASPQIIAATELFAKLLGPGLIFIGLILLAFALLVFFIARGLWKGKNWARIIAIILACLAIAYAIWVISVGQIFMGGFTIIINGLIAGYLLFNKNVREAFI